MRRRPQSINRRAIQFSRPLARREGDLGLVLSGGGTRAAYQVGAMKALRPYLEKSKKPISIIVGSSIGAINGLVFGSCIKDGLSGCIDQIEEMWRERTFRNTFAGSPSVAFFRAIRMAAIQYMAPGPGASEEAVFDPAPLMQRVDQVIDSHGGLEPDIRDPSLHSIAVMTTLEGDQRKPLLFLSSNRTVTHDLMQGASFEIAHVPRLHAKHGFASAALPSVLPPVELDTEKGKVRLVDGGISINVPVDPAARLGAEQVIVIDISGRNWWLDRYNEPHDTRPTWEVPAELHSFCLRPPDTLLLRNPEPFGPLLKASVGKSSKKFIAAVGPIWPVFTLLKRKLGEELAFEVMSYVALDRDYIHSLIETGFNDATALLKRKGELQFERQQESYDQWLGGV
ncbi:MAG: hypothetical protein EBZ48_05900 [Proteobacteria bacterium]|nr:hypothetical protein [Pseudomonadota bacterium]